MVHLHKFFETSSTIYLLLQYASGGKLWNYVGAYLRYAQEQAREGGPGGEDGYPTQDFQNVYTGFKIHTDDNQRKSFSKDEPSGNLKETGKGDSKKQSELGDKVTFTKETNGIFLGKPEQNTVQELSVGDFQLDIQENSDDGHEVKTCNETDENESQLTETSDNFSERRADYNRFTSFSSEENADDDGEGQNISHSPFERQNSQGGQFQDLLQKNRSKPALEDFSINSFDSTEGFSRVDSNVSDQIEVIHEVNELSCDTEVFTCDKGTLDINNSNIKEENSLTSSHTDRACSSYNHSEKESIFSEEKSDDSGDVSEDIIKNSQELLRTVERTLSQIDTEVSDTVDQPCSPLTTTTSSITIDSPEEPSIYDLHRHGDTSDSQSDSRSRDLDLSRPTSSEININSNSIDLITNDVQNTFKNEDNNSSQGQRSRNMSGSRSRVGSDTSKAVGRKMSLPRINSTELSRSASSDYESKSPSKSRHRTISSMFEQLDLSAQNPDQVKIPESFIRRWAAEIIVAVSTLHSLGIICR